MVGLVRHVVPVIIGFIEKKTLIGGKKVAKFIFILVIPW
jgi:hypothetical protein